MVQPALAPYLLRLIQSGLNRFWKCLSRVAKVPNGFENGFRGLRRGVLERKQGFAGMAKYKKLGSVTLFDAQNTKEELSKLGNPLERLSQVVDFEMFRKALEDL